MERGNASMMVKCHLAKIDLAVHLIEVYPDVGESLRESGRNGLHLFKAGRLSGGDSCVFVALLNGQMVVVRVKEIKLYIYSHKIS